MWQYLQKLVCSLLDFGYNEVFNDKIIKTNVNKIKHYFFA